MNNIYSNWVMHEKVSYNKLLLLSKLLQIIPNLRTALFKNQIISNNETHYIFCRRSHFKEESYLVTFIKPESYIHFKLETIEDKIKKHEIISPIAGKIALITYDELIQYVINEIIDDKQYEE